MPAPVIAAAAARTAGAGAARAGAGRAAARRGAGRAAVGPATEKAAGLDAAGQLAGPLPKAGTKARAQRDAVEAVKAKSAAAAPAEPEPEPSSSTRSSSTSSGGRRRLPSALTDQRGAPSWTRPDPVRATNSGAGFVLGLGLYAAGLVYLREGTPGLKRWLAAKFLNRVEG